MADHAPREDPQGSSNFSDWLPTPSSGISVEYKGTLIAPAVYRYRALLEKFQADSQDVCIVSFPKTGTTFMSAVVYMILHNGDPASLTEGLSLEEKVLFLESNSPSMKDGERSVDRLAASPPPRVYHTHLIHHALPESIIANGAKIVYVARNPKDCIVSRYHFQRSFPSTGFNGTLEDAAQDFFNNRCQYGPYFDHIAEAWKDQQTNSKIFFTTFERMLKELRSVVQDLGKFLGKNLTENQLDAITHYCNFNSMKNNDNTNKSDLDKLGILNFSVSPFMRTGKIGNWKKDFSPDLDRRVNEWIAKEENRLQDSLQGFHFEYE